jgi:signal transduction histidine kinase
LPSDTDDKRRSFIVVTEGLQMTLHQFLINNRQSIIDRSDSRSQARLGTGLEQSLPGAGLSILLTQIIRALLAQGLRPPVASTAENDADEHRFYPEDIAEFAAQRGRAMFEAGFTIDEVVRGYGDLCQAIAEISRERDAPFDVNEFKTMNECLDLAIADAVAEFSVARESFVASTITSDLRVQMAFFSDEARGYLRTATSAFDAIKAGNLSVGGSTGILLDQTLGRLARLVDAALDESTVVATDTSVAPTFSVAALLLEVSHADSFAAHVRGCILATSPVDPDLAVLGNRDLLYTALGNVLQNAFKFSGPHTSISIAGYRSGDRIHIDVSDHCGGLPTTDVESLFKPFVQYGEPKTGLGLGLTIARRNVEALHGTLTVIEVPGQGCIFTANLPRHVLPSA